MISNTQNLKKEESCILMLTNNRDNQANHANQGPNGMITNLQKLPDLESRLETTKESLTSTTEKMKQILIEYENNKEKPNKIRFLMDLLLIVEESKEIEFDKDSSIILRIFKNFQETNKLLDLFISIINNNGNGISKILLELLSMIDLEKCDEFEDITICLGEYYIKSLERLRIALSSINNFKTSMNSIKSAEIVKTNLNLIPLYSVIIKFLSKSQPYEALSFFQELVNQDFAVYNCAINALIEALCIKGEFEHCIKMLEFLLKYQPFYTFPNDMKMKKLNPTLGINIISYGVFIKNCCKFEKIEFALNIYQNLLNNNFLQDEVIFNLIIDGCSKNNRVEEIPNILKDLERMMIKPNIITYNSIIDAYVRRYDLSKAWQFYENLVSAHNFEGDNFTFSTLFKGIKTENHHKYLLKAFEILDKLQNEGKQIDIILINVLLDSCGNLKEGILIQDFFSKIMSNYYYVSPDTVTLNTYLKCCVQTNYYKEALENFNTLINKIKPNDVTFNTIIDVCVRSNNLDKIDKIVKTMSFYNIDPDNFTYSTIIKGIGVNKSNDLNKNQKELGKAFLLLENVKKKSKPDEILYNCIMDACLRLDQYDKMFEIFEEMKNCSLKLSSITCGILIKAYGTREELDKAIDVYKYMKCENIEMTSVTIGNLINVCIKSGNFNRAIEFFKEAEKNGIEINTVIYTTLIKGYAKEKNTMMVFEIFNKMKKERQNYPNHITYNTILDYSYKNLSIESTESIFREMGESKIVNQDIISFSTMIKNYIKNERMNDAVQLLYKMSKKNLTPDTVLINSIIDGCEKMNEFFLATEIFTYFKTLRVDIPSMCYSIMMKIFGKLGDFKSSKQNLLEMKIQKKEITIIIYTCYLKSCFNMREYEEATEIYKEIKKKGLIFDEITYTTLIQGFIKANSYDIAKELMFESISKRVQLNSFIYNSFYNFYYNDGFEKEEEEYMKALSLIGVNFNRNQKRFFGEDKSFKNKHNDKNSKNDREKYNDNRDNSMNFLVKKYKNKENSINVQNNSNNYSKAKNYKKCNSTNKEVLEDIQIGGSMPMEEIKEPQLFELKKETSSFTKVRKPFAERFVFEKQDKKYENQDNKKNLVNQYHIEFNQIEDKEKPKFYNSKYPQTHNSKAENFNKEFVIVKSSNFIKPTKIEFKRTVSFSNKENQENHI